MANSRLTDSGAELLRQKVIFAGNYLSGVLSAKNGDKLTINGINSLLTTVGNSSPESSVADMNIHKNKMEEYISQTATPTTQASLRPVMDAATSKEFIGAASGFLKEATKKSNNKEFNDLLVEVDGKLQNENFLNINNSIKEQYFSVDSSPIPPNIKNMLECVANVAENEASKRLEEARQSVLNTGQEQAASNELHAAAGRVQSEYGDVINRQRGYGQVPEGVRNNRESVASDYGTMPSMKEYGMLPTGARMQEENDATAARYATIPASVREAAEQEQERRHAEAAKYPQPAASEYAKFIDPKYVKEEIIKARTDAAQKTEESKADMKEALRGSHGINK